MNPAIAPPAGAVFFALFRLVEVKGRNKETGKKWRSPRKERLYGDATNDGTMQEQWPVREWSVKSIAERYGGGRYIVHWLGGGGDRLSSRSFVVTGAQRGVSTFRPKPDAGDEPDQGGGGRARRGRDLGDLSPFELIQMLDERSERAMERARQESTAQRENDRMFMATMMQLATAKPAAAPTPAAADTARELQLMRRELNVTIQEQMAGVKTHLAGLVDGLDTGGGDDDLPVPKDLAEAAEQVGISLLREATAAAPDFVGQLLPMFVKALRAKGLKPSPATAKRLAALQAQQAAAAAIAAQYPQIVDPGDGDEEEEEPEDEGAQDPQ